MFKKLIAILLILILCYNVTPLAHAVRFENNITLSRYAYSSSDNVYREFSNFGTVSIVMEPGEWTVTPAFHGMDSHIISYSSFQTQSSDPDVAEAKIVHVGASPVSGVANSFIGLEIHAKNVGTTTITVNYATFVTNSQYTDARGTPYFTKQFIVTVADNALQMDVSLSTNEVVLDWPEGYRQAEETYTTKMAKADEMLAVKLMSDGLTCAIMSGSMLLGAGVAQMMGVALGCLFVPAGALAAVGIFLGIAINCAFQVYVDQTAGRTNIINNVTQKSTSIVRNEAIDSGLSAAKSFKKFKIPMRDAIDVLEIAGTAADAELNNDIRKKMLPTMSPQKIEVVIRLTNPSSHDITNAVLELSSEKLSFTSDQGPWSDSIPLSVDLIPANGSVTTDPITVYAKPAFHNQASGISQLMYTGSVAVKCSYFNESTQSQAVLNDSVELPVYTKLNEKDKIKAAQYLQLTENMRVAYTMCPVDVHIMDKTGSTLAILTNHGEPYHDEHIIAGSIGCTKYFIIPQDQKDNYQLKIVAVDDGSMHIVGLDGGEASNISYFSEIPVKKGDAFQLNLAQSVPADLYMLEKDGTQTPIDPTMELNDATIAEALTETDVSEEKRHIVAHALARSLVPATLMEGSFQDVMTLDHHAQLMLNLYERQFDMFPGHLTDMYVAEHPDAKPVSLPIAVAVWKGLLDREYNNIAFEKDATTRLLTDAEALMTLKNFCDIMQLPDSFSFEVDPLTLEQMICMADALWQAIALADKDVDFTVQLTETVCSEMSCVPSQEAGALLYYRENESQKSVLRNSMIYYPVHDAASDTGDAISNATVVNMIVSCINQYIRLQNRGIHPGTPVDTNAIRNQNLSIQLGYTGSGNQVTDEQGWTYTWYPFFLTNQSRGIYMNTVYLFVCRSHKGADATIFGDLPAEDYLDNRVEFYIIADQDSVGNFLATQHLLDRKTNPPKNYPVLDRNSEGEDVLALQKILADLNLLASEPNGVYDEQTRKAVSDFQRNMGLPSNGIADETVQRLLYSEIGRGDLLLEPWLAPYIAQAEQSASTLLVP